jgi:hypothetical protein
VAHIKLLAGTLLFLAACGTEHGDRNDPIASASLPFSPSLTEELSSKSREFAAKNKLEFQDDNQGAERLLTLRSDEIRIEASISDNRLSVVGLGRVTPQSVRLVNEFLTEADIQ